MKCFQCGNCGQIIEIPQVVPKPDFPKGEATAYMIHGLDPGPSGGRRGRGRGGRGF